MSQEQMQILKMLEEGKINAAGLEELKKRMPFADLSKFEENPAVQEFVSSYRAENPYPYATLDDVLDHFDRAVTLAGIYPNFCQPIVKLDSFQWFITVCQDYSILSAKRVISFISFGK